MARPTDWPRLSDEGVFATCVRESAKEIYGYVGLLAGHDRGGAEDIVRELYTALGREVAAGRLDQVDLRRLRTAARRLWLARERTAVVSQASGPPTARQATTLADLSDAERTVVVFRSVNRMPVDAVAEALHLSPQQVAALEERAVRRLGGDVSGGLKPWFGQAARPRPGFVDDLVADAAALLGAPPDRSVVAAPGAPLAATQPVPVVVPATDDAATDPASPPDLPTPDPPTTDLPTTDLPIVGPPRVEPPGEPASPPAAVPGPTIDELIDGLIDEPAGGPAPAHADDAEPGPAPRRLGRLALVAGVVAVLATAAVFAATRVVGDDDEASPASTSAPASTVPVTTAPALDELLPACVERPVTATADGPVVPEGASIDAVRPLLTEPALSIELPLWNGSEGIGDAVVTSFRVRGGVLVEAASPDGAADQRSLVGRVDYDGTVRWVRCFDESVAVAPRTVGGLRAAAIRVGGDWFELDTEDGLTGAPVEAPAAVADSAWVAPDEWPDDSFPALAREGFAAGVTGDVTVVLGCAEPDTAAPEGCARAALRGYGAEQQVLWERAGVLDVALVQGSYAIIRYAPDGGDGAWYMIDITDGSAVDGQVWAADEFPATEPSPAAWTRVDGGYVFVRQGEELRVLVSSDAQVTPATATLP
jgi:hypothetical protein